MCTPARAGVLAAVLAPFFAEWNTTAQTLSSSITSDSKASTVEKDFEQESAVAKAAKLANTAYASIERRGKCTGGAA